MKNEGGTNPINYLNESPVRLEIQGHFEIIDGKTYFLNEDVEIALIGELINACGYTVESVVGRQLKIKIDG